MVGRVTLLTPTAGLPPGRKSFPDVSAYSGPATGCGSGAAPGHIGICVCPGDGCHTGFCALRLPTPNTTQRAKIKGFITILTIYRSSTVSLFPHECGWIDGKRSPGCSPNQHQRESVRRNRCHTPMVNSGRPCAYFFLSDDARCITGQVLAV